MTRIQNVQPAGLISVLTDRAAPFSDRHDAAMDLAAFDEPEAEKALVATILDRGADPDLADAAAESVGEIWARGRRVDREVLKRIGETAAVVLTGVLDAQWPEWRATT